MPWTCKLEPSRFHKSVFAARKIGPQRKPCPKGTTCSSTLCFVPPMSRISLSMNNNFPTLPLLSLVQRNPQLLLPQPQRPRRSTALVAAPQAMPAAQARRSSRATLILKSLASSLSACVLMRRAAQQLVAPMHPSRMIQNHLSSIAFPMAVLSLGVAMSVATTRRRLARTVCRRGLPTSGPSPQRAEVAAAVVVVVAAIAVDTTPTAATAATAADTMARAIAAHGVGEAVAAAVAAAYRAMAGIVASAGVAAAVLGAP